MQIEVYRTCLLFLGAGAVLSGLRVEGSAKKTMQTTVGGCSPLPVQCTLGSIECTDTTILNKTTLPIILKHLWLTAVLYSLCKNSLTQNDLCVTLAMMCFHMRWRHPNLHLVQHIFSFFCCVSLSYSPFLFGLKSLAQNALNSWRTASGELGHNSFGSVWLSQPLHKHLNKSR